ncbi:hypothetical protein ATL17_3092 [Maritalea mobilis]|uniref:Uncharacterized protein n=1 Tax=Maritalea mobilis TaxID=483324 RepID=A0A4R6VK51_9HYPH|nr:hypothetical protein ATL17_3092 [Maritalea mobilis]
MVRDGWQGGWGVGAMVEKLYVARGDDRRCCGFPAAVSLRACYPGNPGSFPPPSFATLTTPAPPALLRRRRSLRSLPRHPRLFPAAVAHYVRYPGTPANWCFTSTLCNALSIFHVTPRLDLGDQFTYRLAEDEATFSGASAILTAQLDCKIKSCNDGVQ